VLVAGPPKAGKTISRGAKLYHRIPKGGRCCRVPLTPTVVTASGRQLHAEIMPSSNNLARDDWLRALAELGHGHREVVEVSIPQLRDGKFEAATKRATRFQLSWIPATSKALL
jgi:hypothetical protein